MAWIFLPQAAGPRRAEAGPGPPHTRWWFAFPARLAREVEDRTSGGLLRLQGARGLVWGAFIGSRCLRLPGRPWRGV